MSIWHTGPVKPEEGTGAAGVRGLACVSLHYEKDAERRWVRVPVGLVPMGRQKKDYSPRRRELGWLGGAQAVREPRGCLRLCFFPSQVSRPAKTGARTVMDGALQPASCQGAWARLSEERPRGRMPGMSSTMCFWGAEEQAELSLEKKDLCCLFLNPGVKCLKIIISRRRGFKNMTRGGGRKKIPTSLKPRLP